MTEVVVCGRCGSRCWATAPSCFNCGQILAPTGQYAYAAPGYAYRPAGPGTGKHLGIVGLTIVQISIGVVGLFVALDLLYWTAYRFYYDDIGYGMLDLVMAAAYVVTSIAAFVLAVGIWKTLRRAWLPALMLGNLLIGIICFSAFWWGVTPVDIVGICVNLSMISALNTNPIRRLFGLRPWLAV